MNKAKELKDEVKRLMGVCDDPTCACHGNLEILKNYTEAVIEAYQAKECGCDDCQTCLNYKGQTMNKLFKEETDGKD
jgi:hypothetical protein